MALDPRTPVLVGCAQITQRAEDLESAEQVEEALRGDFTIAKAWKADRHGNLMFRKTARNFNPMAVTAGKISVVEVEEIVEVGELDPDEIHLPGIYVNRLIQGTFEKRIEQRTTRPSDKHEAKGE